MLNTRRCECELCWYECVGHFQLLLLVPLSIIFDLRWLQWPYSNTRQYAGTQVEKLRLSRYYDNVSRCSVIFIWIGFLTIFFLVELYMHKSHILIKRQFSVLFYQHTCFFLAACCIWTVTQCSQKECRHFSILGRVYRSIHIGHFTKVSSTCACDVTPCTSVCVDMALLCVVPLFCLSDIARETWHNFLRILRDALQLP